MPFIASINATVTEGTISHGTLRTQDLLRSFASEIERLMPINGVKKVLEARETADVLDVIEDNPALQDNASLVLGGLIDQLDHIAGKAGMWFGAHEGDGSDFGFWAIEDEPHDARDDEDHAD